MRKSKVLTKALAAILCIAMLIPMAVTVGAADGYLMPAVASTFIGLFSFCRKIGISTIR